MYKYLEIIKDKNNEVVKRLDVTSKGERMIDKIENGMNINLNHDEYSTKLTESEVELPII